MTPSVIRITAEQCHDLRRRVLRAHQPGADVGFPIDADGRTVHFGVVDADQLVAVSTWGREPCPAYDTESAVRLRGMAVEPAHQGRGIGRLLLAAGLGWAADQGAALVWANARDTALGFYEREGFTCVGDGFITEDTGLAHHLIVRRLLSKRPPAEN